MKLFRKLKLAFSFTYLVFYHDKYLNKNKEKNGLNLKDKKYLYFLNSFNYLSAYQKNLVYIRVM